MGRGTMTKTLKGLGHRAKGGSEKRGSGEVPGIVIADVVREAGHPPRIAAFIWGGKVRPSPTLPYGRWKDVV